jgi:hypothetical protein
MDEPLTVDDRRQAVKGLREIMDQARETVAHQSAE